MNEERFILAWNTPLPDAAFKLTIYQFLNSKQIQMTNDQN
jgi:hypothetical protein